MFFFVFSTDGSFLVVGENCKVSLLDSKTFEIFFSTYPTTSQICSPESYGFIIASDEAIEGVSVYFKNQEQIGKLLVTNDRQVTLVWETSSNYAFVLSHSDLKLVPSLNSNMVLTSNGLLIAGDYLTTNRFVLKSFENLYVQSGLFFLDRSTGLVRYSMVTENYLSSLAVSMDGGVFATIGSVAWKEKYFNYLLSFFLSTQLVGGESGIVKFVPQSFESLAKEAICDADLRIKNTVAYAKGGWVFTSAKEQNTQSLLADTKQIIMLVWQANAAFRFAIEKNARELIKDAVVGVEGEEVSKDIVKHGKPLNEENLAYFQTMLEYIDAGFEDADGALSLLNNIADSIHTACNSILE